MKKNGDIKFTYCRIMNEVFGLMKFSDQNGGSFYQSVERNRIRIIKHLKNQLIT
jgi:hypothetical protein